MAATYGRVNLTSSFGFSALWRGQTVDGLPLGTVDCAVDLMSGMGELWRSLAWGPRREFADLALSSFGLKTFDREQQRVLAGRVAELVKPGGRFHSSRFPCRDSRRRDGVSVLFGAHGSGCGAAVAGRPGLLSDAGAVPEAFGD